ncbi:MAG TPA: alkaline phosphatase D family protein [Kofleriaceae bacterium]|nr:alkaline phosphatase D family protein [Kofleriaceae bacterium]
MPGLSRREWMRIVGAGGAALAVGCDEPGTDELAAAVLEPAGDALLVSVWARRAREATVLLRHSGGDAVTHAVPLAASGIGALDVRGLLPGTAYELVVRADGAEAGPYRASTAPRDDDARRVRFAIIADVDTSPEFDTDLAGHVVAAAPDLLISLGDFPYTDNGPPAADVATYRERHVATRTLSKIRTLLQAMPLCAIYDDHEFANDWDAARAATQPDRYAAALAVWDELFPLRDPVGEIRYRRWRWGAHAECFLLDCRRFRSANGAPDGPAKTMLGAAQLAWLTGAIAASTATFKLVLTSVPLDFGNGDDHWRAFAAERQVLFDALVGIPGVLFLSADQHWFAAHRHAYGIREFQVGPFARGILQPPPAAPGVLFRRLDYNAGIIDIDGDRLTAWGLSPGGERFYEETFTAAELTPRRA